MSATSGPFAVNGTDSEAFKTATACGYGMMSAVNGTDSEAFKTRDVGDLWAGWAFMGNLGSDGRPWATLWRDFLVIFEK